MKHKKKTITKGRITKKHKRSYRRSADINPTVAKKQVEFLADVSLNMTFKRVFFNKLTKKEHGKLVQLCAGLYKVGFEAAGGVVR